QVSQNKGLVRDLNPGPLAPKARIIPLDQRAMQGPYLMLFFSKFLHCQNISNHLQKWIRLLFQKQSMSFTEQRARPGFEPGTSRTQSKNHTPRPTSHAGTLFNAFLQQVFTLLKHQSRSAVVDQITLPATVNEFHRTKGSSGI